VVGFTPRPLYPQGKIPDAHYLEGWLGPRTVLNNVEASDISNFSTDTRYFCSPGLSLDFQPSYTQTDDTFTYDVLISFVSTALFR
jgi:hypothetical protein